MWTDLTEGGISMDSKKVNAENVKEQKDLTKALSDEDLSQVAGGDNPFEDVPRVPLQPIDDKLRNNG